jgi:hypothetical protein
MGSWPQRYLFPRWGGTINDKAQYQCLQESYNLSARFNIRRYFVRTHCLLKVHIKTVQVREKITVLYVHIAFLEHLLQPIETSTSPTTTPSISTTTSGDLSITQSLLQPPETNRIHNTTYFQQHQKTSTQHRTHVSNNPDINITYNTSPLHQPHLTSTSQKRCKTWVDKYLVPSTVENIIVKYRYCSIGLLPTDNWLFTRQWKLCPALHLQKYPTDPLIRNLKQFRI